MPYNVSGLTLVVGAIAYVRLLHIIEKNCRNAYGS